MEDSDSNKNQGNLEPDDELIDSNILETKMNIQNYEENKDFQEQIEKKDEYDHQHEDLNKETLKNYVETNLEEPLESFNDKGMINDNPINELNEENNIIFTEKKEIIQEYPEEEKQLIVNKQEKIAQEKKEKKEFNNFDDQPITGKQNPIENNEIESFPPTNTSKKPPQKIINKKPLAKKPPTKINEPDFSNPPMNFDELPIGTQNSNNIDELPIGKSNKFEISEYPPDYNQGSAPVENVVLPLSERLKSKVWKIRQQAFEELSTNLETMQVHEILNDYPASEMCKYINDSNVGAQEKALVAFIIFIKKINRPLEEEDIEETLKNLFEKVLISAKATIKKAGSDILFELYEKSIDKKKFALSFLPFFGNKNPKTAATAIATFVEIIQKYGVKKLEYLKPWLPEIEKIASNSNVAAIKTECLNFLKEAYLFLGPDLIKLYTGKLKKQQQDELEKYFLEIPFTEPKKPIIIEIEEEKNDGKNYNSKGFNDKGGFDVYDISDPVEIFSKFNENWMNKVLAFEKWNEKKDALEEFLRENASVIKISPSQNHNISTIQTMLKRLLMDSNVQVTTSAIKIIGFLCKGLRKSFYGQAKALFPFLLERLKEKKGSLLDETQKSLENMLFCLGLEEVFDVVKENLEGKNVQMKLNSLIWVEKSLLRSESLSSLKNIMPTFKKLLDDGSNEVRTQMITVLGRMMNKISNEKKDFILSEIPSGKLSKFEDALKKATNNEQPSKSLSKDMSSKVLKEVAKDLPSKEKETIDNKKSGVKEKSSNSANNSMKKDASVAVLPKKNQFLLEENVYEEINNIPEEDAERILKEKGLKDEVLKGLSHQDWKEKQKSIAHFYTSESLESLSNNMEEILVLLRMKLKNFKESNINISKELFIFLTNEEVLKKFDNKCFNIISPLIIDRANDSKFSEQITQILCKSSEKVPLKWIIPNLILNVTTKASNNIKTLQEIIEQIDKVIQYVSNPKENPLKDLVGFLKPHLSTTNLGLKNSLGKILQTLVDLHGKKLIVGVFGEIPANLLKLLKFEENEETKSEEIKEEEKTPVNKKSKNPKNKIENQKPGSSKEKDVKQPPPKTLTKNPSSLNTKKNTESKANLNEKSQEKTPAKAANTTPDLPKVLTKLKHKEWNIRKEGLEELDKMDVGLITKQQTLFVDLINTLKTRLTDPNKPLARQFVIFTGNFIKNFDKDLLKPHYKQLIMGLLANLSDKNATVRTEIITTLKVFLNVLGSDIIINLIAQYYLSNDSPEIKSELLHFITETELNSEKIDYKSLINPVLSCLLDKNKEIRLQSETLLRKLIDKIGQNPFVQPIRDLKPAMRSQVENIFGKIVSGGRVETTDLTDTKSFDENKSKISQKSITINQASLLNSANHPSNNANNKSAGEQEENEELAAINNDSNLEIILKNGCFTKEISSLQEDKKARLSRFDIENLKQTSTSKKLSIKEETMFCYLNAKQCLESHKKCPLQKLLSSQNDSDYFIFEEYFVNEANDISNLLKTEFYQKLYQDCDHLGNLKFLYEFFSYILSEEKCIELQSIDELSDLFIQYLSYFLLKSCEKTEEAVVLALETTISLMKIVRFNCNQISSLETLFLIYCVKIFIEKGLDLNSLIQKIFKNFFLSLICNCKDLKTIQILFIMIFLNSDPESYNLRYRVLKYLSEFLLDSTEPEIEILSNLPEIYSDKDILAKFLAKFSEEDILKRTILSKNQLNFGRKLAYSDQKNQELDKMINETKNSIIRRQTYSSSLSLFKKMENEVNNNPTISNSNLPKNEKIMDSITEDILKNPIVNQQITSEVFLADLKLLEDGNAAQKIDALMFLNDLATSGLPEHSLLFQKHSEQILISFLYVFKHAFALNTRLPPESERNPLQFLQYFLNMLQKFISSGLFLRYIEKVTIVQEFIEELCVKMLWEEGFLSRDAGVNSGIMLLKLINLIVLRCLECGDQKTIIICLLKLMYKFRKLNSTAYIKLQGLIAKCLLKLCKFMGNMKENHQIEGIHLFLQCFYDYVKEFYKTNNDDDVGIATIKCLLYEICKAYGDEVWNSYKKVQMISDKNDKILENWISMILKTLSNQIKKDKEKNQLISQKEEGNITFEELKIKIKDNQNYNDENLMELADLIEKNPQIDKEEIHKVLENTQNKYFIKAMERLLFIKQCPWIAEEIKTLHRGADFSNQAQIESKKKIQNFHYKGKFLMNKYQEMLHDFQIDSKKRYKNKTKEEFKEISNQEEDIL